MQSIKSVTPGPHLMRYSTSARYEKYSIIHLKCLPLTSAVANNPNQNVYHLPPNLCIL